MSDTTEENPFVVLELEPTASRIELERKAQKLLQLLAIGSKSAATYASPSGPRVRTEELVRLAAAALRDPETRLVHELSAEVASVEVPPFDEPPAPWAEGFRAIGWKPT